MAQTRKTAKAAASKPDKAESSGAENSADENSQAAENSADTGADENSGDETQGTENSQGTQNSGDETQQPQTGRQGDSGPGTGVDAPAENTARMPAETVNSDPDSAPLDPPADSAGQTEPEHGHNESSTDHTYAQAAGRSIAGETHVELVDEDNDPLDADDLFDESDTTKTYVVTRTRIYEKFLYPNTSRYAHRLLYAEGRRVPRFQAERIKAAAKAGV